MFSPYVIIDDRLVNHQTIQYIDCQQLSQLIITVHIDTGVVYTVTGNQAIDVIMATKPSIFEGQRLKFPPHRWIVHNLIAHPLMQLLALIGFKREALWVHDVTIPRPIGIKDEK